MILTERAARLQAEAVAASAKAEAADAKAAEALISYLKLEIEKLRRQIYGSRSERKARLMEQMELELEELEATASEDELAAERAADFNLITSRTWRIANLSVGIQVPLRKAERRDRIGARRGLVTPGRHHPGMVGEIISEWWATSNRNGGRDHSGMVGDIERNEHHAGKLTALS
jgi:hypothetical protein